MRKALLLLLGLLLIGILSYFCFTDKSPEIKKDLISKTETIYKNKGLEGIKVGIKGEGLKQTRIITLNGEVTSKSIKKKAEEIALSVDGVAGVENNLIVNSSIALVNTSNSNNTTTTTKVIDTKKIAIKIENNSSNTKKESINDSIVNKKIDNNNTNTTTSSTNTNENILASVKDTTKIKENTNINKDNNITEVNENILDKTKDIIETEENNSIKIDKISKDTLVKNATTIIDENNLTSTADKNQSLVDIVKINKNQEKNDTKDDNNTLEKNKIITPSKVSTCESKFKELLENNKIHFAHNKATISHKSYSLLDKLIKAVKSCPNKTIIIEGHTDSDGSETYNQRLSEKRANAVKEYLIKHGVSASRLKAIGYGEKRPIADNSTEEGKEKNRRIELKIKGEK